jgi:hypothetical protein
MAGPRMVAAEMSPGRWSPISRPQRKGATFDFDGELVQVVKLIEAARAEGVPQFVRTTVFGADCG